MYLIYILLILIIPISAQIYVKNSYRKYSQIKNATKLSGFEVARKILDNNGLNDIHIVETRGNLTDHYDPTRKVVRLSHDIFSGDSVSSMAIAAHECGHAIQDKEEYFFLKLRSLIYPIVKISSSLAYVVIFIGIITTIMDLIWLGIVMVGCCVFFQLITLPVEFNASRRAENEIKKLGITNNKDEDGTKIMLKSAALTYVASLLVSILELLRLIINVSDR